MALVGSVERIMYVSRTLKWLSANWFLRQFPRLDILNSGPAVIIAHTGFAETQDSYLICYR